MPSHRADTPPLRRPRGDRSSSRSGRSSRSEGHSDSRGSGSTATAVVTDAIPVFADSYAAFTAENPLPVPQPELRARRARSGFYAAPSHAPVHPPVAPVVTYDEQASFSYEQALYDQPAAFESSSYQTGGYETGVYADDRYSTGSANQTATEVLSPSPFPTRASARRQERVSRSSSDGSVSSPAQQGRGQQGRAQQSRGQQGRGQQGSRRRAPGRASHPSLRSLSAPQVGIAGVLGIATIAAPISGAMASSTKPQVNTVTASSAVDAALLPGASATASATASAAASAESTRSTLVTRASRSSERSVLPGCSGIPTTTHAANGRLPLSALCTLWDPKHHLRADAAVALAKLNIAYKAHFGHDLCLTDSYRSYNEQVRLKAQKPGLAAVPGTSNHGWGLAVDLGCGVQSNGTAQYNWMRENAGTYGWDNPSWALPGGGGPHEPWHWEFESGVNALPDN